MDEVFSKKKKKNCLSLWSVVKLNVEKLVSGSNEFYITCREGFKVVTFLSFNTFSNIFFNFPFVSLLIIINYNASSSL